MAHGDMINGESEPMMLTGRDAIAAFLVASDGEWIRGSKSSRDGYPFLIGPCPEKDFLDELEDDDDVIWDGRTLRVDRDGVPWYSVTIDRSRKHGDQSASTSPGPLGGTGLGCGSHGSGGTGPGTGGGGGIGGDGTCIGS